jgi:hypothetical protein
MKYVVDHGILGKLEVALGQQKSAQAWCRGNLKYRRQSRQLRSTVMYVKLHVLLLLVTGTLLEISDQAALRFFTPARGTLHTKWKRCLVVRSRSNYKYSADEEVIPATTAVSYSA